MQWQQEQPLPRGPREVGYPGFEAKAKAQCRPRQQALLQPRQQWWSFSFFVLPGARRPPSQPYLTALAARAGVNNRS